jgi:DtxR family transcriptional regulator, Mn-dependent transcriptional regulator
MAVTVAPRRDGSCCPVQVTETVEGYLKAIYHLSAREGEATTTAVAARMGVAPPSTSAMVHRLQVGGLVEHAPRGEVVLTPHGRAHALAVVRRHRLLETFLARVLGLGWDEVHAEAEALEHCLSERLEDRIDAALGHPERDPHGDPIPPKTGPHEESGEAPLAGAAEGDRFLVERVYDSDSAALRYLAERGIRPGVVLVVEDRTPFGGPLWVRVDGDRHALGAPLVRLIHGRAQDASERPLSPQDVSGKEGGSRDDARPAPA